MICREELYEIARAEGLPPRTAQSIAAAVSSLYLDHADSDAATELVRAHIARVYERRPPAAWKSAVNGAETQPTDPDAYMYREA